MIKVCTTRHFGSWDKPEFHTLIDILKLKKQVRIKLPFENIILIVTSFRVQNWIYQKIQKGYHFLDHYDVFMWNYIGHKVNERRRQWSEEVICFHLPLRGKGRVANSGTYLHVVGGCTIWCQGVWFYFTSRVVADLFVTVPTLFNSISSLLNFEVSHKETLMLGYGPRKPMNPPCSCTKNRMAVDPIILPHF